VKWGKCQWCGLRNAQEPKPCPYQVRVNCQCCAACQVDCWVDHRGIGERPPPPKSQRPRGSKRPKR